MNKEKLAQLLAEALDKTVNISLHFGQYQGDDFTPVSEKEAHELITRFAEALGTTEIENSVGGVADQYVIETDRIRICCSYVPETKKEEALA